MDWVRALGIMLVLPLLAAAPAGAQGLRAQQGFDQVVNAVGYRLATAAGDLCPAKAALPGFLLHDLSQYSEAQQAEARATFGFAGEPLILAVAPTSPAAAAGVREGDALLAVDGTPVPDAGANLRSDYARIASVLALVDRAAADRRLQLRLRRGTEMRTVDIALDPGCPSRFQTKVSSTVDSEANGEYVQINTGLIEFAGSEAQLAGIVAHELAHNILRHRERLDAQGIRRGLLGQFGRSARLVRRTEEEADRLSVYLMDRAGYPPEAIVAFWEHYRKAHILGFLSAPTHMSPGDRIALVNAEIARIAAMKAAGQVPRPAFMTASEPPKPRD